MGLKDLVNNTPIAMAPSIVIYGGPGIGKTTVAMDAPGVIFISTDMDSTKMKGGASRLPITRDADTIFEQVEMLIQEEHEYKTLAIDDLSGLASFFEQDMCAKHGKNHVGEIKGGFGKGERFTSDTFIIFLNKLDELRAKKNMAVILIGHSEIKEFKNPEGESYDRHQIELHKYYSEIIIKWCDILAFGRKKIMTTKKDEGTLKQRSIGISKGERVFAMEEKPAFKAKSRYNHADEVEMTWAALAEGMK